MRRRMGVRGLDGRVVGRRRDGRGGRGGGGGVGGGRRRLLRRRGGRCRIRGRRRLVDRGCGVGGSRRNGLTVRRDVADRAVCVSDAEERVAGLGGQAARHDGRGEQDGDGGRVATAD